jgi:ribonuclease III
MLLEGKDSFRAKIYRITGLIPGELRLYRLALRHSSTVKIKQMGTHESYERLEFLGDAVLGMIVGEQLYKLYPLKGEGFLTEMRSKIVNRGSLSDISRKMGIPDLIEYDQKSMGHSIARTMGGDALEALIGAVYLDRGYFKTRRFVLDKILSRNFSLRDLETLEVNYKSRIMEYARRQKWDALEFVTFEEGNEGRGKVYKVEIRNGDVVLGIASDPKKKIAEQKAAEVALSMLQSSTTSGK